MSIDDDFDSVEDAIARVIADLPIPVSPDPENPSERIEIHPEGESDVTVQAIPPLTTIVRRIRSAQKTQKISISKSYNTSNGNIFTSRTVAYTEVVDGVEVGGLEALEASIATQMLSLQVDKDSIQRAFVSGYINANTRDEYIAKTTDRHTRMIREIYEKAAK